jgi:hypothetical protein
MADPAEPRLFMSANGVKKAIGPDDPVLRAWHESLVRKDYDDCHPGDSFANLKQRALYAKEDQGLLRDWMALAAARAEQIQLIAGQAGAYPLAA